jgi:hypothetical protein
MDDRGRSTGLASWLASAGITSKVQPSHPQQQGRHQVHAASSSGGSAEEVAAQLSALRLQHSSSRLEDT